MRIFVICLFLISFLFAKSENPVIRDNSFGALKVEKFATGGVPMKFNIQGFVATSSGVPVTGFNTITFKIFRDNEPTPVIQNSKQLHLHLVCLA